MDDLAGWLLAAKNRVLHDRTQLMREAVALERERHPSAHLGVGHYRTVVTFAVCAIETSSYAADSETAVMPMSGGWSSGICG